MRVELSVVCGHLWSLRKSATAWPDGRRCRVPVLTLRLQPYHSPDLSLRPLTARTETMREKQKDAVYTQQSPGSTHVSIVVLARSPIWQIVLFLHSCVFGPQRSALILALICNMLDGLAVTLALR